MDLKKYIDHTILKPDTTEDEVKKICTEAIKYNFASVCVNPYYAAFVNKKLKGTGIKTCVVVGFPLGANTKEVKAFETNQAIENGAEEVDMVINIGALKDKNYQVVKEDIHAVINAAKGRAIIKVIIETCLLTTGEKEAICEIAKGAKVDFVKTSTGFSKGGATESDVLLMRNIVGKNIGVKASGAVRDYKTAMLMIEAGANRIGTSNGIAIVSGDKDIKINEY